MKFLLLITAVALGMSVKSQPTIYSFKIDSISGGRVINFSAFKGKKILLINAASADSASDQYAQIKQLNSIYKDSLVIIVVPSNSFNTENSDGASMLSFYSQDFNNRFPVAKKLSVTGVDIAPLYQWLTQKTKNGVLDSEVRRSFQKYLISKSGKLIGVFSSKIKPLDAPLIKAITNSSN